MKRVAIIALVGGALVLLGGACDDGRYYDYRAPRGRVTCGQLTSCDVCTPVVGCGWCQLAGGGGVCTDGPDDCPPPPLATWTWDPIGCHHDAGALADASVESTEPPASSDASTGVDARATPDASAPDTAAPADATAE